MRVCFFSAHSLNSIPVLPLLANELTGSFGVEVYHIRVESYAQFSDAIREHLFAVLPDRNALQHRSRWFNLRRYGWLIGCFTRKLVSKKNTIVYCTDDSCLKVLLLILRMLHKRNNIKVVYHEFENVDHHNKLFASGRSFTINDFKKIDLVITPEKNRLNLLLNNLGIDVARGLVIPNSCFALPDPNPIRHKVFESIEPVTKIICHIGAIGGRGHCFREFLEAMPAGFTLLLVGTVQKEIISIVQEFKNTKKIVLSGQVSHEDLKRIYPFIDYGLILYKGVDYNFEYCAPNKLYEFWSYGVPVLAHTLSGLIEIFEYESQGKLFDFTRPDFKIELQDYLNKNRGIPERNSLIALFNEKWQLGNFSNRLINHLKGLIPEA